MAVVPIYTHLMDYFNDDNRKISQVFISLTDKTENKRLQINQTFWNNQNNSIVERLDSVDGVISYHELIIETLLPTKITGNAENNYEILRFSQKKSI